METKEDVVHQFAINVAKPGYIDSYNLLLNPPPVPCKKKYSGCTPCNNVTSWQSIFKTTVDQLERKTVLRTEGDFFLGALTIFEKMQSMLSLPYIPKVLYRSSNWCIDYEEA